MFMKHLQLFSKATDAGSGGGPDTKVLPSGDSTEDIIDFLSDESDEPETIPLDKSEAGKDKTLPKEGKDDDKLVTKKEDDELIEEEPDELALLEEELDEPSDEQLELVTPVRRREILAKYPQLFKDFPYLEKAYYREQQYTELLPTIEDAKIAVDKSNVLDGFERDVMNGSIETILKSVRQTNENSFYRIVDNYMNDLASADEKAYLHVLGNISRHTIMTMIQEAQRLGIGTAEKPGPGMALQQAAHTLNQHVFGNSEWKPPSNLSRDVKPEDNTRERQLSEREQSFIQQQFETARGELNNRVNNQLRNTIDANIDPKNSMTEWVKRTASKEALDTLERLINQDTRFKSLVDKLWEAVFKSNFSRESTERIKSAYVSKAKTLLPAVIKKARNEALRGMGKRVRDNDEETIDESTRKQGPIPPGRPRSQTSGGKVTKASEIPRGMTTLEFLNQE